MESRSPVLAATLISSDNHGVIGVHRRPGCWNVFCDFLHTRTGLPAQIAARSWSFRSASQAGLLDRLLGIAPKSLTRFSFANSGAEAVENAVKVARAHTGKQNIISFDVSPLADFSSRSSSK